MFSSLTRWNPFEELSNLHRQMDRFFTRAVGDPRPAADEPTSSVWSSVFYPSMDIVNRPDAWVVRMTVPGVDPDRIEVDLAGQTLTVRGERLAEEGERYYSEIPYGRFERTITLPSAIDTEQVKASYRHGILELTLPLKESVKPRRIEIASSDRKALAA